MTKSRKYSIIGAVCFLLYTLHTISIATYINILNYSIDNPIEAFFLTISQYDILDILRLIMYLGFVIGLFLKNKIIIIISFIIRTLYIIYFLVQSLILEDILYMLGDIIILIMAILSLKNNQNVKRIWFFGWLPFFIADAKTWIEYIYLGYIDFSSTWAYMLVNLILDAGYFFTALWLKEDATSIELKSAKKHITSNIETAKENSSNFDDIEKLKKYKELLDSNVITQEEFDEKKKQMLGL